MLLRCVDDQLSFAVESPSSAQAAAEQLRASGEWLEVVPGIDSVVVRFDIAQIDAAVAQRRVQEQLAGGVRPLPDSHELLEIPVVYGGEHGPDLDDLCLTLRLSIDEFIALHSGREYRVEMLGFTPGFAFVGGLDERLRVPRRAQPRQRVAPGSIGIADAYTGMYALASPGGWTLVGRTPHKLFDPMAAEPFPLRAGTRIRFRPVDAAEFES
jgi:KipI family sensor histidine kinase inhibitor